MCAQAASPRLAQNPSKIVPKIDEKIDGENALNKHERAIKNKDKFAGASIHMVTEKLDSGKVILQKKVKILKSDTVRSLEKKVLKIEHQIYPIAIDKFLTNL